MKQYLDLLQHILDNGVEKGDRTGTGTISTFGYQMRFNLQDGFPLVTTKRVPFRLVLSELLWFIAGDTNIRFLVMNNNHIWDDWPYRKYKECFPNDDMTMEEFATNIKTNEEFARWFGDLGPVYGRQWRSWATPSGESIDQLDNVIEEIKFNPDSRRHMVVAYNPADVPDMALPPCHSLFQFYVANGKLSCQLYQRSGDAFLGIPFNIASYALLTHMVAQQTGLEVGEFIHTLGDAHIYKNHIEQVKLQLTREPKRLPMLGLNPDVKSIFDYTIDDVRLGFYEPHPTIKGDVSV